MRGCKQTTCLINIYLYILFGKKCPTMSILIRNCYFINNFCRLVVSHSTLNRDFYFIRQISTPSLNSSRQDKIKAEFLLCVKKEDTDEAFEKLQSMKKGIILSLPLNNMSEYVDLLVRKNRLGDLSLNASAIGYVINNANSILKPLLEKYSCSGNVNPFFEIVKVLPDFALIDSFYNDYLTKAYLNSKRHEDLMKELEERWNKKNKLFSVLAFEELMKIPNLEKRVIALAKKYLECNFDLPMTVVWAHYLIKENYEKATEIINLYPVSADKVDVMVLKVVQQQENVRVGKAYISTINHLSVKGRLKERAYGTLLEVLVLKGLHEDASRLVIEAEENNVNIERPYRSTLVKLKNALERENKHVPFTISS